MLGSNLYSAKDIAKWFLNENRKQMNFGDSEFITNLKLQKLLYYAQGCYLAKYNKPLFKDDFVAWEHGPVIKSIYDEYKKYGSAGIQYDEDFRIKINEEISSFLEKIYNYFGQYTAWKLRDMTHQERPWIETKRNNVISKNLIKEYFNQREDYANI